MEELPNFFLWFPWYTFIQLGDRFDPSMVWFLSFAFAMANSVVLTWFRIKLNKLISVRAHDLWDWIIQSDARRRSRREISWCRCCRGYSIRHSNDFANSKAFPAEARIEFHLLIDIITATGESSSHSRRTNNGKSNLFIKFMPRKFMFGRSRIGMEKHRLWFI